jgi:hypothetical protein
MKLRLGDKSEIGIRFKCEDICNIFGMAMLNTHISRMLKSTEYGCSPNIYIFNI